MNLEESLSIIFSEANTTSGEGLLVSVKSGEDPGAARMSELNSALGFLFQSLEGQTELNRRLAAALFTLGSDVPLTISSWASKGHVWRKGFMEGEVYEMLMWVQSIFEGKWLLEPEQAETVH
ncbi:MAG: hypothetical protein QOF02_1183 [Blastocatellia bacterium]|jgi:hypothetical protein|nr:hypothetical protein [Blastocatellia bacterium]